MSTNVQHTNYIPLNIDDRNNKNKPLSHFRNYLELAMGVMYVIIAYYLYSVPNIALRFGKGFTKALCIIIVIYGIIRMIRGISTLLRNNKN